MQQILAYETDLLEYDDLFDGNPAIDRKVAALKDGARAELAQIDAMGGAVAAIDYMKGRLVEANSDRLSKIETKETTVVGVNRWTEAAPSPLTAGDGAIMVADADAERDQIERLTAWRAGRDANAVKAALAALREAAQSGANIHARLRRRRESWLHHGRMGRDGALGLRRIPRPHRRVAQPVEPHRRVGTHPRGRGCGVLETGPPVEIPCRQARP